MLKGGIPTKSISSDQHTHFLWYGTYQVQKQTSGQSNSSYQTDLL